MPILALNQLSALSSGADLWVCPDLLNSRWAVELDWHLNHQIRRGLIHQTEVLDNEVKGLLYQNQISWTDIQAGHQNLLISSSLQLPARWVLMTPWNGILKKWAQIVFNDWKKLGSPTLRVFLPQNIGNSEFTAEWQKMTHLSDITVVLD